MSKVLKKIFMYKPFLYLFFIIFSGCILNPGVRNGNIPENVYSDRTSPVSSQITMNENNHANLPDGKKLQKNIISKNQDQRKNIKEKIITPEIKTVDNRLPTENICMEMKNEKISLVLRTLARGANQNIMISDNVSGTTTINIQNEPWDKIFLSLLHTYGLSYEWEGNIIRIITVEDIDKEFKRLDIHQKKEAKQREIEKIAPLEHEVIKINYADTESLKEIFDRILEADKALNKGIVMVDKHTNSLIIKATQKDIDEMKALVKILDRPTSQIRIEARIVEATGDAARELGVEWGGLYRGKQDFWITPGTALSDGTSSDPGQGSFNAEDIPNPGLIQQLPTILGETAGLNIGFIAQNIGQHILSVRLSALEKSGKLKILSSPSISTLDNQTAIIESGREVPYQTVEDNEVNIEFKKAVLSLEVTPSVIKGKMLKLSILTYKDELDFSNSVEGNPTVITKKAQTNVLLRDGQTTVIGGLRKETNSDTEIGVPFLKDIPLLGALFRKKSQSNNMEEILIFITPHIVSDNDSILREL